MSAPREGDRVSNYVLEQRLGAGSFADVFAARHHILGTRVAVKIPTNPVFVRALRDEGVAAHSVRHPNVVRVLDLDPHASPPYLIMELIEGPSLRAAIDAHGANFPIEAAVTILRGVLRGLQAAHSIGLVHRDIKPANILLEHPTEQIASITEQAVKVSDFGLGLAIGAPREAMMQSMSIQTAPQRELAGTLAYMSPEQREGRDLDGRSDLYSCGVVLFEMLTGERPQGGEMPSALRPNVPKGLDEVYARCYARLDRRFESAEVALSALDGARPDHVSVRRMPPLPSPVQRAGQCPSCRGVISSDDNFCIHCGQALVEAVPKCRHCGEHVHLRDRYCIRCGRSLIVLS